MNKIAAPLAIITGLLGLALTTRSDILYSLPIGSILIITCGVVSYINFIYLRDDKQTKHNNLLEMLSLEKLKTSLNSATEVLKTIVDNQNTRHKQLIEKISENNKVTLTANSLLDMLTKTLQFELKSLAEQQSTASKSIFEAVLKSLYNLEECTTKIECVLANNLKTIDKTNTEVMEEIKALHSFSSQANELLGQVLSTLETESKTLIAQQQSLYEIILDDIKETLANFSENQLRNAEDATDRIKRTMNETNRALSDLPMSLERFNAKNSETMQKAVDGFAQFEALMKDTLEQLTSISKQDCELLYKLLKGKSK